MDNKTPNTSQGSGSWDTYWQGTGDVGAFSSGGVSHPAISAFWSELFNRTKQNNESPKILDIASGNGAVIENALAVFQPSHVKMASIDISEAAIKNIQKRFPDVEGIVSSANAIAREDGSFDIVSSQYGIEYAGHDAVFEAARLVADGGTLALLMHCESGYIHQECQQSLDAVKRTQKSKFIPLAIKMFETGFKAVKGADRKPYDLAAKKLKPAIAELESIMRQYGTNVAGDTICRLYNDVGQIHQRIQHYNDTDVLPWLQKLDHELSAYAKRMESMNLCAVDAKTFDKMKKQLKTLGFSIETGDKFYAIGNELPMAWALIASK